MHIHPHTSTIKKHNINRNVSAMFGYCQKFGRGGKTLGTFVCSVLGIQVTQKVVQAVRFLEIVFG